MRVPPKPQTPNQTSLLGLREVSEALGVHYMTAYRYVRTGQLPAHLEGDVWKVHRSDVKIFLEAPKGQPGRRAEHQPQDAHLVFAPRLQARLIAGDESGAWKVIEAAMVSGATPNDAYLLLLAPSLAAIGDQWERGHITIAQEHIASAIALRIIGRLGPRFTSRGQRRGTVILGSAPGDQHSIATAILADLVRGAGFRAIDLGPNTPAESFCMAAATASKLCLVGISCSTNNAARSARRVTEALRAQGYLGPIIVGGNGVRSRRAAANSGASDWARDGIEFLAMIETV